MTLRYDHAAGAYIGERYRVENEVFDRALRFLLDAEWEPDEALSFLLAEDNWSAVLPGVRPVDGAPRCLACGNHLPAGRSRFCGAVCEATAHLRAYLADAS